MDAEMHSALSEMSALLGVVSDRLGGVANALDDMLDEDKPGNAALGRTEDPDCWLRGARRELAELIREVEGPRPRLGGYD